VQFFYIEQNPLTNITRLEKISLIQSCEVPYIAWLFDVSMLVSTGVGDIWSLSALANSRKVVALGSSVVVALLHILDSHWSGGFRVERDTISKIIPETLIYTA